MKSIYALICFISVFVFLSFEADARIRNRKVREAPKVCKLMTEDVYLSRGSKKVYGTLRHSLIFENIDTDGTVSLVKDKGEKVCQWAGADWVAQLKKNQAENLMNFKYHIDEYKEVLYAYAHKSDGSYFVMNIPFSTCSLDEQVTRENLDLPKCQIPKKSKKKKTKRKK